MVAIALDTATGLASVGVLRGGVWHVRVRREPLAAQTALALVDEALAEAGAVPADVRRIAVGCGPGSFTALRIGLATARGLAAAVGADLLGASTLGALREGAGDGAVAVVDARRGEVFAEGPGLAAQALAPAELAARLAPGTIAVGDGALAWREPLEAFGVVVPPADDPRHAPGPAALLAGAERAPVAATPVYLRAPDAVPAVSR